MSKINKSRNLFLEKEELVRQDRFIQDDGLESFIKSITKNGGIVPDNEGSLGDNFLPVFTDYGYVTFSEDSIAYNTQGERMYFKYQSFYQYKLPTWTDDSSTYWMYIQKGITSIEDGTIVMGANGAITGSGTSFTELFRGQTSLVPNKIKIYAKTESSAGGSGYTYASVGTYEVNEVESDTVMYVNAFDALSGTAYVYSVVGAFSPGTYDDSREEEIYEYDFVDVVFSQTDPTDTLTDDQYLLAKIKIDTDFETNTYITDLRSVYSIGTDNGTWIDVSSEIEDDTKFSSSPEFFYKINNDETVSIRGALYLDYSETEDFLLAVHQIALPTINIEKEIPWQCINGAVPRTELFDDSGDIDDIYKPMYFYNLLSTNLFYLQVPLKAATKTQTLTFFAILQTEDLW